MSTGAPPVARSVQGASRALQGTTKLCAHCKHPFKPERATARYCSGKCRVTAWRVRQGATPA
jgi:hypothetical protein